MKLPLSSIRVGQQRCVNFNARSVLICRTDSGFFAIDNMCPHAEFPLSGGAMVDDTIRCPTHGAKFDLRTGKPLTNPRLAPVRTYSVTVEGEFLLLQDDA